MKYLYLLGIISIISFSAVAQSRDQQAVSNAVEKLRKAMIDGDRAALANAAADSLSYGHSSGKIESVVGMGKRKRRLEITRPAGGEGGVNCE